MRYLVTAGYVTVPTAVNGSTAHVDIRSGAVLPDDVPAELVESLLARGDIAEQPQPEPAPKPRMKK
jgi:hypothetical protein